GSGKSTILELLYYMVYILGTTKEIDGESIIDKVSDELRRHLNSLDQDIEKADKLKKEEALKDKKEKTVNSLARYATFENAYEIIHRNRLKIPPEAFQDL